MALTDDGDLIRGLGYVALPDGTKVVVPETSIFSSGHVQWTIGDH